MPHQRTLPGLSRRDVLVVTGSAIAGVTGLSHTVHGASSAPVTVGRDQSLAPVSDGLEASLRQTDIDVSVRTVSTEDGFERLRSRDFDVFHAARPLLPKETATVPTERYAAFESVGATALLRSPERWRSMLSPDQLETLRASNPESQTWTELVPSNAASQQVSSAAIGSETTEAFESTTERSADTLPSGDTGVVVRGLRADQYADGYGGFGYYEAQGEELTTAEDPTDRSSESLVGRLRYTYVDTEAANEGGVESFVQLFVRHARERFDTAVPVVNEAPLRTLGDRPSL